MLAFYTDPFVLPLPPGHCFSMAKYVRLRERCLEEGSVRPEELREPAAATWEELALVHEPEYLARVETRELTPLEQRRIGFPWSAGMVERSRRSAGATISAARAALAEAGEGSWGVAAKLAGGYARDAEDTVDVHLGTLRTAALLSRSGPAAHGSIRGASLVPHS